MCPSSGLWGGVLDCDSQFTILSPPSFDGPQLWRFTSVCSSLHLLTRALMLLSLSSVTNLSLLFGFCAACMLSYRCLQMEWRAAVTVVAIPAQPALLMWPCVSSARPSVLSPRASRAILHSRHPADCILPILVRKLAVRVFPATAIPNRLLLSQHHCWISRYCGENWRFQWTKTWFFTNLLASWPEFTVGVCRQYKPLRTHNLKLAQTRSVPAPYSNGSQNRVEWGEAQTVAHLLLNPKSYTYWVKLEHKRRWKLKCVWQKRNLSNNKTRWYNISVTFIYIVSNLSKDRLTTSQY